MKIAQCDSKGRLYLKEALRHRYGNRFLVVEAVDEVLLLPVSDDPLEDLEQLGKELPDISVKEIRKAILKRARQEILS